MKKTAWVLCLLPVFLFAGTLPPLSNVTIIPDFTLHDTGETKVLVLPALPDKPGVIPVLRCRMVIKGTAAGGCNYGVRLSCNGTDLGAWTASGKERLLCRESRFEIHDPNYKGKRFPVFRGADVLLVFAPDVDQGDGVTLDNKGSQFCFDLSDVNRTVDCNEIVFRNIRSKEAEERAVLVTDIEFGWMEKPADVGNDREFTWLASRNSLEKNGIRVDVYEGGGFAVSVKGTMPLVVETALGVKPLAEPALLARTIAPKQPVRIESLGDDAIRITTQWPDLAMERILRLKEDRLDWTEKWHNTGKEILGVPFRHQCGLAGDRARVWLRGEPDTSEQLTLDGNATVFFESRKNSGTGTGIVLEDDILRLIAGARVEKGVTEIHSPTLALAPGTSRTFHFSVVPTLQGGYWSFINQLRERWEIGSVGAPLPFFWGAEVADDSTEEKIRKGLAHLGPIAVILPVWVPGNWARPLLRQEDISQVTEKTIVDNQQKGLSELLARIARYKRALPESAVMTMAHPMMRYAYLPEFEKNPLAPAVVRTKEGEPYHHGGFDSILLRGAEKKGWAVIYALPRPGNALWESHLNYTRQILDAGADGVYFDEFSSCNERRSYSRYDYAEWDGFSADLDENGKVARLKSDCAYTSLAFQNTLLNTIFRRGKLFLGNGSAVSRDIASSPALRFTEGASSHANMTAGHLNHVPLVLGNYGKQHTLEGVLAAVREALLAGCIYSPMSFTHRLLQGADNFVCKLYPVTIRTLGPGTIIAKERIITCVSGTFEVPENCTGSTAKLYLYTKDGMRDRSFIECDIKNRKITVEVPEGGLVIAEFCP